MLLGEIADIASEDLTNRVSVVYEDNVLLADAIMVNLTVIVSEASEKGQGIACDPFMSPKCDHRLMVHVEFLARSGHEGARQFPAA